MATKRRTVGVGLDLKTYRRAEQAAKRIHVDLSVATWARRILIAALETMEQTESRKAG